jgi:arabinan endo-1,5-alpha-L-arabinosidase
MQQPPTIEQVSVVGSVFPGDDASSVASQHVHDPTIVQFKGMYFCFSTSGDGFGVVRSSKGMLSWKVLGPLFDKMPNWIAAKYPGVRSVWAPDVVILGDKLRVYYCVSKKFGANSSVIGIAECDKFDVDNPLKGWHDVGMVLESVDGKDTFNAIDPEVLVDKDGRHWLFYGSYWAGIYVVELAPATGFIKKGSEPVLAAKNTTERGNPLEGAAACYREGYYYLFVSYGLAAQGIRSTYRIMVGRSKTPNGPFLDADNKAMSDGGYVNVLKTSPPMFSPGHSDVFKDSAGRYLMPYHFYDGRHHWHGDLWGVPTLQVRELLWSADGWPLPGMPVEYDKKDLHKGKTDSPVGKWRQQADFGEPRITEYKADGTVSDGWTTGTWKMEGKLLKVRWPSRFEPSEFFIDTLQFAYDGAYYVGRNQAGSVIRGTRER